MVLICVFVSFCFCFVVYMSPRRFVVYMCIYSCDCFPGGKVEFGTQKHFPMEVHSALAIPEEGSRMQV